MGKAFKKLSVAPNDNSCWDYDTYIFERDFSSKVVVVQNRRILNWYKFWFRRIKFWLLYLLVKHSFYKDPCSLLSKIRLIG